MKSNQMSKIVFRQLLLLALFLTPNFVFSQINVWAQCFDNFFKGPEAAILKEKIAFNGESTPVMFSLNRKVTPSERTALEKFIHHQDDCYLKAGMAITSKNPDNLYFQLKDGLITFSAFALENLKRSIKADLYFENLENLEKAKKEKVAIPQVTTLSCLWESGPLAGTEKQFQINESAKSLWSSSGAAPSDLDFGPTLIRFRQGTSRVEISRNTGRFSTRVDDNFFGGKCELITERKF
jgi:hypothetical protein